MSKCWDEAGATFEQVARCHLKLSSAHEAATAYQDAANCYKKTNSQRARAHFPRAERGAR